MLDQPCMQSTFGQIVGISQQAVSELRARKILTGDTAGEWLLCYCRHLREIAAGRSSDGGLDLVRERARLAHEQANRVSMQNAIKRRAYAPVFVLELALADICKQIAGILEALPVNLKRRSKNLTAEDIEYLTKEIVSARNVCAAAELDVSQFDGYDGDKEGDSPGADTAFGA